MATNLRKTIVREVRGDRGEALTVRFTPAGIVISEKGRQTKYGPVAWSAIFSLAAKQAVAEAKAEAKADKKRRVRRGVLKP